MLYVNDIYQFDNIWRIFNNKKWICISLFVVKNDLYQVACYKNGFVSACLK